MKITFGLMSMVRFDKGRKHNGNLFASNPDRLWCIRAGLNERQWLKDHPGVWRPLEDVLREAAAWKRRVEGPVETIATGPSSQIQSDILKDDKDADGAASAAVPEGDPLPPDPTALTMEGFKTVPSPSESDFEDEITIDGQRYVSAERLVSIWGMPRRTLSRRIAAGKVPPKKKIGNKLYFAVGAIPGGPAADESDPAHYEAR
jgi:hypothetical protein